MTFRITRSLAGLAVCALLAPLAALADDDPFDRPGWYIGAGGSFQYNPFRGAIEDEIEDAIEDEATLPPGTTVSIDLEESFGANARVGYRACSWFALELQYEWVDEYEIDGSTNIPGVSGNLYSIEGHTITANTKWIVPFWRLQPYFLLGGGVAISRVDRGSVFDDPTLGPVITAAGVDPDSGTHTDAAGRAGIGLDVYVTPNVLVNAEAAAVVTTFEDPGLNDIDDLNYLSFSAGLQYRF